MNVNCTELMPVSSDWLSRLVAPSLVAQHVSTKLRTQGICMRVQGRQTVTGKERLPNTTRRNIRPARLLLAVGGRRIARAPSNAVRTDQTGHGLGCESRAPRQVLQPHIAGHCATDKAVCPRRAQYAYQLVAFMPKNKHSLTKASRTKPCFDTSGLLRGVACKGA